MDLPDWARRGRSAWRHVGTERPWFAESPQDGQESVWDYPRPPRLQPDHREVVVRIGEVELARSKRSVRVLETASPPTFYLPRDDVRTDLLKPAGGSSRCEWKGEARYWSVAAPDVGDSPVAWSYPDSLPGFQQIRDHFSFYPSRLGRWADGVRVKAQPGRFYGGWVTPELAGPFKGEPGSEGW